MRVQRSQGSCSPQGRVPDRGELPRELPSEITVSDVFKKLQKRLKKNKDPNQTSRVENYKVWDKKNPLDGETGREDNGGQHRVPLGFSPETWSVLRVRKLSKARKEPPEKKDKQKNKGKMAGAHRGPGKVLAVISQGRKSLNSQGTR